ncbi:hypothetical protein ACNSPD_02235 [Yersinia enterocolitica]|uniref:hypothetical protein n=1 Tax=Yersinia enterocolitica TaxID=630 RepID=UPI003AB5F6B5
MILDKTYGPLINCVFELDGTDIHPVISPSTGERLADLRYFLLINFSRGDSAKRAALLGSLALVTGLALEPVISSVYV